MNVLGWNVGGSIEQTLNDNAILPRLRREDFIFIAETHTKRIWNLDLTNDFNLERKDRAAGKAGGVAWLWAKRHTDYVRNFAVDIRGVLVLEVDLRKRGGHKFFLVGAYFPPAGPSISSKEAALERADISQQLPVLLSQLSRSGLVMVV